MKLYWRLYIKAGWESDDEVWNNFTIPEAKDFALAAHAIWEACKGLQDTKHEDNDDCFLIPFRYSEGGGVPAVSVLVCYAGRDARPDQLFWDAVVEMVSIVAGRFTRAHRQVNSDHNMHGMDTFVYYTVQAFMKQHAESTRRGTSVGNSVGFFGMTRMMRAIESVVRNYSYEDNALSRRLSEKAQQARIDFQKYDNPDERDGNAE